MSFKPWTLAAVTLGVIVLTVGADGLTAWAHVKIPVPLAVLMPNLIFVLLIASIVIWIAMVAARRSGWRGGSVVGLPSTGPPG